MTPLIVTVIYFVIVQGILWVVFNLEPRPKEVLHFDVT